MKRLLENCLRVRTMRKYFQVVRNTFQEYFVYRLNFIMWRVRTVIQFLLIYFLWSVVFQENQVVFGYDKAQILTYILGVWVLRALVLATRTDGIGLEIARGDLSLYLLRPISYIKYWFSRDISDKIFNIGFFLVEATIIISLLKPPLIFQTNLSLILFTLISVISAVFLLFSISFLLGLLAFGHLKVSGEVQDFFSTSL